MELARILKAYRTPIIAEWITRLRLEGGFALSEVQNAYDLYRKVLGPILVRELKNPAEITTALQKIDACLLYTIKRFSNFYQSLHEKEIRDHAQNLEREVAARTRELSLSEGKYRVLETLQRTRWHLGQACSLLGISRPTLRSKLREYALAPPPRPVD